MVETLWLPPGRFVLGDLLSLPLRRVLAVIFWFQELFNVQFEKLKRSEAANVTPHLVPSTSRASTSNVLASWGCCCYGRRELPRDQIRT